MRPDIARLLTPHIYSELENHPSVLDYENIKVRIVFVLLLFPFSIFLAVNICLLACMGKRYLHLSLTFKCILSESWAMY